MAVKQFRSAFNAGTGMSGAGGAMLVLFFFAPWFSACGRRMTGENLASGMEDILFAPTLPAYPILFLIPILGLVALGLALLSLLQRSAGRKGRAIATSVVGGITIGLMLIVLTSSLSAAEREGFVLQIEHGYFMSLWGAISILGGGLTDLRMAAGARAPAPNVSRPQVYHAPPEMPTVRPDPSVSVRPRVRLIVRRGPLANQTLPVVGENVLIGRGSDCDLRLADRAVSRRHARLRCAQGAWFIQDQGSAGGILVNGRPQKAARLNPGDEIQIGSSTLTFYPEE